MWVFCIGKFCSNLAALLSQCGMHRGKGQHIILTQPGLKLSVLTVPRWYIFLASLCSNVRGAIIINLGTQVARIPYNFIQPPAIGTLSQEQEVVQPLPGNAEKELRSYEANSSGGIPLLYVCILGYPAWHLGASPEDYRSPGSLVTYLWVLHRCYG